jgi:GxxExxY protein
MTENEIGTVFVDAAIAVHRVLGPGLLESVYEVILAHELRRRGLGG